MSRIQMIKSLGIAFLILAIAGLGAASFAQTTTATLTGTVTDPSNAAISKAQVTAVDNGTGIAYGTETNETGGYNLPGLPPSAYTVTVSAPSFGKATAVTTLTLQQTQRLDFALKVGSGSETITVSEAAVEIQTESHEIADTLPAQEVEELPSNGRDVFAVLSSSANFTRDTSNLGNSTTSFFGTGNQSTQIGGIGYGWTGYLQDGVSNLGLLTETANMQPDVESISEVGITQSTGDARLDAPNTVNIITKSGSSGVHGLAYNYLRNDALDAINELQTQKPPLRENQFGVNVGGPLVKNHLFYFLDYSGLRQITAAPVAAQVPTAAEAAGDFSADNYTVYDPATWDPTTNTISAFPGNKIPQARFSQFYTAAAQFTPTYDPSHASKIPGTNYEVNSANSSHYDAYQIRLDGKLGANDTFYAGYQSTNPKISDSDIVASAAEVYVQKDTNVYAQETHSFSGDFANTVRVGYNRANTGETTAAAGTQNFTNLFGLTTLNPSPSQWSIPFFQYSLDGSSFGGWGTFNPYAPQTAIQHLQQFVDEVNWTHLKHYVFFGGEVDHIQFDGNWTLLNDGEYSFGGQYTSNHIPDAGGNVAQVSGLADMMLGLPTSANGGTGVSVGTFKQYLLMPYIQDNWHLTQKLILNLGLRYDFYQSPNDTGHNSSIFLLKTATAQKGTFAENRLDFAPRVGFAYALPKQSSVHGGYGYYYAHFFYNELQFLLSSPPNFVLQGYNYLYTDAVPVAGAILANPGLNNTSPSTVAPSLPTERVEQWSLAYEKAIGSSWVASASYLGSRTTHQEERINPNMRNEMLTPGQPQVRPYPNLGDVSQVANVGKGNYEALLVQINRNFHHGLSLNANYIYGSAKDDNSASDNWPEHANDIAKDYGPADFLERNVFKFSGIYELPIGPGKQFLNQQNWLNRELLGGWRVSTIFARRSGYPFSTSAADTSNTGVNHAQRGDEIAGCNPNSGFTRSKLEWFNTACFAQPAFGRLGNEPRNDLTGPATTNTDLSAFKNFEFGEGRFVQFRTDFFNAFNHVNWGQPAAGVPATGVTQTNFGQITSYGPARNIQMALKLNF